MKKRLVGIVFIALLSCAIPSYAASDYIYYGVHYEANGTLGNRFTVMAKSMRFYWISDCYVMPGLVAGLCGWLPNTTNSPAGSQMKWFGTRFGGAQLSTALGDGLSLGLELNMDFYNLGIPTQSATENRVALGAGGGLHALMYGSDGMTILGVLSGQWISDRVFEDGQKTSYRIGADLYADVFAGSKMVVYGNVGYGYFPNGVGGCYPMNKGFGGMTFNLGVALP
jgi:hypothetical protein